MDNVNKQKGLPEMQVGKNQKLLDITEMFPLIDAENVRDVLEIDEERKTAKKRLGDSFRTVHIRRGNNIIARRVHGITPDGIIHLFDKQKIVDKDYRAVTSSNANASTLMWKRAQESVFNTSQYQIANMQLKLQFVSNFDKYTEICSRMYGGHISTLQLRRLKMVMDAGQSTQMKIDKGADALMFSGGLLYVQLDGFQESVPIPPELISSLEILVDVEKKSNKIYVDRITTVIQPFIASPNKMELLGVCVDGTYITRQYLPEIKKDTITLRVGYGKPIQEIRNVHVEINQSILGFLDTTELTKLSKTFIKDI